MGRGLIIEVCMCACESDGSSSDSSNSGVSPYQVGVDLADAAFGFGMNTTPAVMIRRRDVVDETEDPMMSDVTDVTHSENRLAVATSSDGGLFHNFQRFSPHRHM